MALTAKDLRAIHLAEHYNHGHLPQDLKEHQRLCDALIYLHEAIADEKVQVLYWQKTSEILFYKFLFHALTLQRILKGMEMESEYYKVEFEGKQIIDTSSAKTVFRAQLEAFLMYHHIYVNPTNDSLKELRYNAWIYSSLMQRQNFPATTDFAKEGKAKDLIELSKLKEIIVKLDAYQELTEKQQKSLLDKGSGKLFLHWEKILKETGFDTGSNLYTIYTLLCMYAHSEGLSIIQLNSGYGENTKEQARIDIHHSKLLICLMINSIRGLYPVVEKRFETLAEQVRYDIEIYAMMARKLKE